MRSRPVARKPKRRLSRQQRVDRQREALARFDLKNRPALLAARRTRQAPNKASGRRKVSDA
jgi:hypothetical protein